MADITSTGETIISFTPGDASTSNGRGVIVTISCNIATSSAFEIGALTLEYYYA